MRKIAGFGLLLIALILSCTQTTKIQRSTPVSSIPVLRVLNDTGSLVLKISSLSVDVTVVGNIATTTFDITFYNSLNRVLEGEFDFPLADGQQIARYALDVNGALREGVVVEKATARIAFESTVRRGIDPGLVEKTKGNNFRTRIFPIPAKGYKRVLIATEQTLPYINNELFYQVMLSSASPIDNFSLKTSVLKSIEKPVLEKNGLTNFEFRHWQNAYVADYQAKNYVANNIIAFTIPNDSKDNYQVFTETSADKTYFYASCPMNIGEQRKKQRPSAVGILWDVSGSGEKRNMEREIELLEKYLSQLDDDTKISLIPFSVGMQPVEQFSTAAISTLVNRLKNLPFDGGTQLGAIDLSSYKYDEVLLFTDGLSTFGKKEAIMGKSPVIVINSSASADYSYLKNIAQQSHGIFINLNEVPVATALNEINGQTFHFISFTYNANEVEELYTQPSAILANGFSMAGMLKQPTATITANFGFGNTVTSSKVFRVSRSDSNEYNNIKRAWASLKIAQLDLEYAKNKETITQLGKTFSIVTQNTSLIVLDRVEDYVEHEIVPPVELQKEYFALLKEQQKDKEDEKAVAFNEALDAIKSLKEWYNSKISKVRKPQSDSTVFFLENIRSRNVDGIAELELSAAPMHFSVPDNATTTADALSDGIIQVPDRSADPGGSQDSVVAASKDISSDIKINEWKPNAPYLAELEKTPENNRFAKYLELKKQYGTQPAFFVDVSRFFMEKKNMLLAIQVLSNIAEMKLDDPELLRMVANLLLEMNETDLAIELFKDILEMREEQPQSYRDLALAYSEAGKYDDALSLLYKLVTGNWDDRFGDVKAIALNEMNAIISANKDKVTTSYIDTRLIYSMPLDVRIVVGWSSDNSDVDLWVTDPHKEKCFYQYQLTSTGGKLSKDVTQGYGPEEFCLKKAATGNYDIDVNLYGDTRQTVGGPITIKAELFTDYGKPSQKRKLINFRVTESKEVVKIGALSFAK